MPYSERRLDRHPAWFWPHIGLLVVAAGIEFASIPANSLLFGLPRPTVSLLALCMGLGCVEVLSAALLPDQAKRRFTPHADRMQLYALGALGSLTVAVSLAAYAWLIESTGGLVGTLAGGISVSMVCMNIHMSLLLLLRVRRMQQFRNHVRAVVEQVGG